MRFHPTRVRSTALLAALVLAGCSTLGTEELTTASVPPAPKVDPVCVTLTTQIETLRKEGIAERIEKAAAKKLKLTAADLIKADQLTKANAEFQNKCSATSRPASQQATVAPARTVAAVAPVVTSGQ